MTKIGLGGNLTEETRAMQSFEVQKLYTTASKIEEIANQCNDEGRKQRLKDISDSLIGIADQISLELECMED